MLWRGQCEDINYCRQRWAVFTLFTTLHSILCSEIRRRLTTIIRWQSVTRRRSIIRIDEDDDWSWLELIIITRAPASCWKPIPNQNKNMKQQHCDYGFSLKRVWSCGDPVQAGNFRVNFNSSIREGGICFLRVYLSLHSLYTYGDVRIQSLKELSVSQM